MAKCSISYLYILHSFKCCKIYVINILARNSYPYIYETKASFLVNKSSSPTAPRKSYKIINLIIATIYNKHIACHIR